MRAEQDYRLARGGRIDRARTYRFTFDGRRYEGHPGDTLASALLANGVRLVGRSFKYHRPRGIVGSGPEEPNALVELRSGERREANTKATLVELFDGLEARSQNRWPSLTYDLMAVNGLMGPALTAGFYYKTFMWPRRAWTPLYERFIRRAAGLGSAAVAPDPDRYEKDHLFADVLVVGAGPAGLAAALAAGRSGARVALLDERPTPGGSLYTERRAIGDASPADYADAILDELEALPNVRLLPRTTVVARYDHGVFVAVQRVADHKPVPDPAEPRQRLWEIVAKRLILATGAVERPLVFAANDKPGVMLAHAGRRYAKEYGVAPGGKPLVFTTNDSGWETALDLAEAGLSLAGIVDARATIPDHARKRAEELEVGVTTGVVDAAAGGRVLEGAIIHTHAGEVKEAGCDCLLVAGGWTPQVGLAVQPGGARGRYDVTSGMVLAGDLPAGEAVVGAAAGRLDLALCLADGFAAGHAAADALGHRGQPVPMPEVEPPFMREPGLKLFEVRGGRGKAFVDMQHDVTAGDIRQAALEGYTDPEHAKRYTTWGMATDQGRTSTLNGLAILAEARGVALDGLAPTTARPPIEGVAVGAFAHRHAGAHFQPVRRSPVHAAAGTMGAVFLDAGLWKRAHYFPKDGEGLTAASLREARAVRATVGVTDVSTLGKIEVQGPDAHAFLEQLYCNNLANLKVGRARYGLMLREDGVVLDDGTVWRLDDARFLVTTTTANAAKVMAHMELYSERHFADLAVAIASTTDQWAGLAVAGPRAREVLTPFVGTATLDDDALPHMGVGEALVDGVPGLIGRLSFSGERAYEVYVPADYGAALFEDLVAAARAVGGGVYGLEALDLLRLEKGHVTGNEMNGETTAADMGLTKMVSRKKPFVGRRLLEREALADPSRPRLVGLTPVDRGRTLRAGAHLVPEGAAAVQDHVCGRVTSVGVSLQAGHAIGLALLADGDARHGQRIDAVFPLFDERVACEVTPACTYDQEGKRLRA